MPPKRFCQLCLRLTRRRKNLKPESALSESLSPARLMHGEIPPSGFASFIYSPVSDYTHAAPKQNNSLGGKKTHLAPILAAACRLEVSPCCMYVISLLLTQERERLFCAFNHYAGRWQTFELAAQQTTRLRKSPLFLNMKWPIKCAEWKPARTEAFYFQRA